MTGVEPRFAICMQNEGYSASLELRKLYRVLPEEDGEAHGYLRVIDESGEDYLFPADWFSSVELPRAVEDALLVAA